MTRTTTTAAADGRPVATVTARLDGRSVLTAVRAFYLDIAEWVRVVKSQVRTTGGRVAPGHAP